MGELPKIQADYQLIYQVMFNLLSNAIKHSSKKKDPLVEISAEENGVTLCFPSKTTVRDSI